MADVILVGEPMVLFYANEPGSLAEVSNFSKGLAGAEVNVGIGLSRLGHDVNYMTKLSNDDLGTYIHDCLKKEKLDSNYIAYEEGAKVGLMFKTKVTEGDPETLYYRKGSAASTLSPADVDKIDFKEVKLLHMTGIPAALSQSSREACFSLMKAAREAGCYVTFDPNLRPALWECEEIMVQTLNELACYANLVLPGVSEGELLTGKSTVEEISDFYIDNGAETVVIKDGGKGAYVKEAGQEIRLVPGFKVDEIVDTVGAGDGFAVGIIDGYLSDLSITEAVKNANGIGAIQIQHVSDNEGLPTRAELEKFVNQ